uniref:Uncharacterized protein n=1 Tax=Oryza rufipogon TaxID=4529 RepID=A0A0E0QJ28_ORYRU
MEAAGGAARGFRRRVPEPGWWVLRAVERSLRRRLSRAVAAWLPATVVVGWVTAVAGIAPIVGRWVGGEVGRAMEVAGVHVVGAGQHVFMLLVVPIAVLLMVMQLRLLAGPLMGGRGMLVRTIAAMELSILENHRERRGKWNQLAQEIVFPLSISFVLLGVAMIGLMITGFSPEKEFSRKNIGWILADVGFLGWHALVGFFLLPKVILTLRAPTLDL